VTRRSAERRSFRSLGAAECWAAAYPGIGRRRPFGRGVLVQSGPVTGDPAPPSAASQPGAQPVVQPLVRPVSPVLRWGGALLFALLVSDVRSLTLPASLLVLAGGAATALVGKYAPPLSTASSQVVSRYGVAVWAGLFVAFVAWELSALLVGNNNAHPTFSMLADPVLTFGPTRALCAFAWLACGWYLLAKRPSLD
jgi:hypothetical protein